MRDGERQMHKPEAPEFQTQGSANLKISTDSCGTWWSVFSIIGAALVGWMLLAMLAGSLAWSLRFMVEQVDLLLRALGIS